MGKYGGEVWWGSMLRKYDCKYGGEVRWQNNRATIPIGREIQCLIMINVNAKAKTSEVAHFSKKLHGI